MMSDPNFEWEQLINVNYNNFFKNTVVSLITCVMRQIIVLFTERIQEENRSTERLKRQFGTRCVE